MEREDDERTQLREAVSLEVLHQRLAEHRRFVRVDPTIEQWSMTAENAWADDGSLLPVAPLPDAKSVRFSRSQSDLLDMSESFTSWTKTRKRKRTQSFLRTTSLTCATAVQ